MLFFLSKLWAHAKLNFKKKLIIGKKIDLDLSNLQRLICQKTQTTYQPANELCAKSK